MELLQTTVMAVCSLLMLVGEVGSSQIERCQSQQRTTKHIELCHVNPRPKSDGPFKCYQPHYGFVLISFKIAPRSEFDDCGPFVTQNYLDPKCLRNEVDKVGQFDAIVFDLLEKVSRKNEIDNNTVVDRFSWKEKEGGTEDSSAFVSFQNLCKPAVRSSDKADNQVVRMCSRDKATNSIVVLTLQGKDTGQLPDGLSRCRCTLSPPHSLTLKAFDIRLQHNKACSPDVSLKMYSGNQTFQDLRCDGLSAHYGLEQMLTTDRELTLDLTVSNHAFPTAVWLQVLSKKGASSSLEPVIISCGGITPLDNQEPVTVEYGNEDKGTSNTGLIGGLVAGHVAFIVFAAFLIFILIRHWRLKRTAQRTECSAQPGAIGATGVESRPAVTFECYGQDISLRIVSGHDVIHVPDHTHRAGIQAVGAQSPSTGGNVPREPQRMGGCRYAMSQPRAVSDDQFHIYTEIVEDRDSFPVDQAGYLLPQPRAVQKEK